MSKLLSYWHTVRYLKPIQLYGRLWFKIYRSKPDLRQAPELRDHSGAFLSSAGRKQSLQEKGLFTFLGESASLDDVGWDNPSIEKLWRYNQHYFDDLNAAGAESRKVWHHDLFIRWIKENPPGGGTGWEPYPTSLRIVNWIKWSLAGNTLPSECLYSLAVQIRWLRRHLEFHLLGNHLFANAKALVFAGMFFHGSEADTWLEKGLEILNREIPEQILTDGGQFERSTMYHALALEDMLDLYNVVYLFKEIIPGRWTDFVASWPEIIGQMRHWLRVMCHPDREISFFNDAAIGISPSPSQLEDYAERLGFQVLPDTSDEVTHLAETGYIRIQKGQLVAILDVAPVGPDYLPGHAHADTLSFELSLFEQRVFVNSGTSCYGISAERHRQRGTALHNTVVIDDQNSSEVWGGFRVARRARPFDLKIFQANGSVNVECAHDGYQRLFGNPCHKRRWKFGDKHLLIEDTISGRYGSAEARFYLHPSVIMEETCNDDNEGSSVTMVLPHGQTVCISFENCVVRTESSFWYPEFGANKLSMCLVAECKDSLLRSRITWSA
jgi:uncharacterized heparinase superfamily protein